MHKLGISFLIVNAILAIGAVLLSARLINTRNHWMQQVEQREDQIRANDEQIAQKKNELAELRNELGRQRNAWDTMLVANSRANPNGSVIVNAGLNIGFGAVPEGSPPPVVHVFIPQGNGTVYLGPFRIAEVGAAQSQLEPLFRVQPNEPQEWPAGDWRFWQVVPANAPSRVVALTSDVVKKVEAVAARQDTLALQQKAVEQAQAHLESRRKELLGDPQAPKIEEAPEISEGLVAAFRQAEADRNAGLAELDRLRRAVDEAYERLTRLVDENTEIVRQSGGVKAGAEISSAR